MAVLVAACCAFALPGCGDGGDADATGTTDPALLPGPQPAGGAVTDMPDTPGPGGVPLSGEPPPAPPALLPGDERFGLPPLEDNPEAGLDDAGAAAAEPTPADAAATVRDYYAAIGAGDFARAWSIWSDDGRGSGQSAAQFAQGFADVVRLAATVGEPGPVEAAAGSRYVRVPVGLGTVDGAGRAHRYAGHVVLRRAVVDGATEAQRAWRIASVELRETGD